MVGFLSRIGSLFGGREGAKASAPRDDEKAAYQDLLIFPTPVPEGGLWRVAATIVTGSGDDGQSHCLIRADVFSSRDDAVTFAVRKAKQVIDEQGEGLFADATPAD